jgi:hypothetical protein
VNITDVPQSGVYYQQGAAVQLVVQMIDITTGLPVPLGAASGLSISILYPDRVTTQTFVATLYTDGSDGMVTYTTKNLPGQVDLSQVGLYAMQADAVIGGVSIPPSYETDFYVLPNVFGGPMTTIATPSAIVLYDSASVRWVGTVSPAGTINWIPQVSGPPNALQLNQLVMKDDMGVYWTFTISTLGVLTGARAGTFPKALEYFFLSDINGKSWIVTASEAGTLVPA